LPLPVEQDMVVLPSMSNWDQVAAEYEILGLSPDQHAMAILRRGMDPGILTSAQAVEQPDGGEVRVAGLVVCRQRPSTAKGVLFVSLEDDYGIANLVVWPQLFERQRTLILTQPFLVAHGRVQRQGTVVHIIAHHFERPEIHTDRLIAVSHDFH
jgi:error-prone DNA polymerase